MRPLSTLCLVFLLLPSSASAQHSMARSSPERLTEAWVRMWNTYDLNQVGQLFLRDNRVTYFSSEKQGLITDYPNLIEHHRGFGFEQGGSQREASLWIDVPSIAQFGETAVVATIWYFGDPDEPGDAQRGPMSLVAVTTPDGYRIAHMHFASYAGSDQ